MKKAYVEFAKCRTVGCMEKDCLEYSDIVKVFIPKTDFKDGEIFLDIDVDSFDGTYFVFPLHLPKFSIDTRDEINLTDKKVFIRYMKTKISEYINKTLFDLGIEYIGQKPLNIKVAD